jgi:hypothetical protein
MNPETLVEHILIVENSFGAVTAASALPGD